MNRFHFFHSSMKRLCSLTILSLLVGCLPLAAQTTEMEQDMFETMREGDKAVVVVAHRGPNDEASRQILDRLNQHLRDTYPNYAFRETWTSPGSIGNAPTPDELFSQLQKDGYTHVLVQSSSMTNDTDMQYLRQMVEAAKSKFKHLRLGEPLLSNRSDYEEVAKLAMSTFSNSKEVNVLVCNSTEDETDAQYTLLDCILRDQDTKAWFVATIDGFPSLESLIKQMKQMKAKKLHLIPFALLESGKVSQQLRGEWTKRLEQAGFKVTTDLRNMGDMDAIIDIFKNHIRHAEQFRTLTAKEQKLLVH